MKLNVAQDKQKAMALLDMATITLERLKELDKCKYPANTLTDYYDTIHKLMEAITSIEGIKIKGDGAHQELIDYICQSNKLGESARNFIQGMRDYRNRIAYEGFGVTDEYIKANSKKIEELINKLVGLVKLRLFKK